MGWWMQRFRVLVRASHPPPRAQAEVLELKIHYLCFCAEAGGIFTLALRERLGVAKTGATFTRYFSTLAKLNAVAEMRQWKISCLELIDCCED